ncbi:hypothetical protein [Flavobacterium sp.]|uniref:hypothetical protein n=1 Tax=Flavobacterium sp. TaxID=239 RepID=UPI00286DE5B9|nr:hypothetical protein [Flavobacterium sp.]
MQIDILNDYRKRLALEQVVRETKYDDASSQKAIEIFEQKIILDMKTFNIDSIYLRAGIDLQTS